MAAWLYEMLIGGLEERDIGAAVYVVFVFQAEVGIRDLVRSRGLGDVYKRQGVGSIVPGDRPIRT